MPVTEVSGWENAADGRAGRWAASATTRPARRAGPSSSRGQPALHEFTYGVPFAVPPNQPSPTMYELDEDPEWCYVVRPARGVRENRPPLPLPAASAAPDRAHRPGRCSPRPCTAATRSRTGRGQEVVGHNNIGDVTFHWGAGDDKSVTQKLWWLPGGETDPQPRTHVGASTWATGAPSGGRARQRPEGRCSTRSRSSSPRSSAPRAARASGSCCSTRMGWDVDAITGLPVTALDDALEPAPRPRRGAHGRARHLGLPEDPRRAAVGRRGDRRRRRDRGGRPRRAARDPGRGARGRPPELPRHPLPQGTVPARVRDAGARHADRPARRPARGHPDHRSGQRAAWSTTRSAARPSASTGCRSWSPNPAGLFERGLLAAAGHRRRRVRRTPPRTACSRASPTWSAPSAATRRTV